MAIATLTIDLVAKIANIERDLGKAAHVAERNAKRMEDAFAKVGTAFAALGGVAALAGIERMVSGTAQAADELSKLSQRTGVAVEGLSALKFAAELNDASLGDLERGLKGLSNKMLDAAKGGAEASAAFSAIGVDIRDAGGNLRAVDDVFGDIADAFAGMEDGAAKAALANKLMEESGLRLIPTLNAGREGLAAMGAEAAAMGAIIGTDLANASVEFNDNMTRLGAQMEAARNAIGGQLVPVLAVASGAMADFGKESAVASRIGEALTTVFTVTTVSVTTIAQKFGLLGSALGAIGAQVAALLRGDFGQISIIAEDFSRELDESNLALSDFHNALIAASRGVVDLSASQGENKTKSDAAAAAMERYAALLSKATAASKGSGAAEKARNKELEAARKLMEDIRRNQEAGEDAALDALRALQDSIAARRRQNEEIGIGAEALSDLRAERLRATAAQKDETAAALDAIEPGSRLAELYRQQAIALRQLAEVQREGDVKQATVEAAEAARDAWADISNDVADSLTDAILQGGDAWKTLVNQIEATVIRATISPIVQGATNAVLQGLGLGPGGGIAGGLFDAAGAARIGSTAFSNASNISRFGTAAFSTESGVAFANATGTGLDGLLASNGAFGTSGSVGALSALGYGAAVIAFGQWFANLGDGVKRFGAAVESSAGPGGTDSRLLFAPGDSSGVIDPAFQRAYWTGAMVDAFMQANTRLDADSVADGSTYGRIVSGNTGARLTGVDPLLEQLNESVLSGIGSLAATLGASAPGALSLSSSFLARGGDDSTGRLSASIGGRNVLQFNQDFAKGQAGFEAFATSFDRVTLAVLANLDDLDAGMLALARSIDPATAGIEAVQTVIATLGDFAAALDLADTFGDIETAMSRVDDASRSATQAFFAMQSDLRNLAQTGDASVDQILAGMDTVYAGFVQMLGNIDTASASIGDSFDGAIRGIRLSVLDAQGQYEFLEAEAARYFDVLRSLTDPAQIQDYAARLQGSITQGFGVLDADQQAAAAPEFIALLEEANSVAQQRLDAARDAAISEQRETAEIMRQAIRDTFAEVGVSLVQSIPKTIGVNVGVTVDSPVPAVAEVGIVSDGG